MKRIIFVNQRVYSDRGGGENFDIELSKELVKKGYDISFLGQKLPKVDLNTHNLDHASNRYYVTLPRFRDLEGLRPGGFILSLMDRIFFQFFSFLFVYNIRNRVDIVQTCSLFWFSWLVEKFLRKPVFSHIPGIPDKYQSFYLRKLKNPYANGDVFRKTKHLAKVIKLNVGVNRVFLQSQKKVKQNRIYKFIYVGRLVKIKNLEMLIEAANAVKIKNFHIDIIGEGPEGIRLTKLVKKYRLGKKISFLGFKSNTEISALLSKADCFIITSTYENFSNSVIEAMASGLPVIATNVGGFPDQLRGGKGGLLVDLRADSLANAMEVVLQNRIKFYNIGMKNRKYIEANFSWKKTAEKIIEFYKKLYE